MSYSTRSGNAWPNHLAFLLLVTLRIGQSLQTANSVIKRIADVDHAIVVDADPMRTIQAGFGGKASIAVTSGVGGRSGNGPHQPVSSVNQTNRVILGIDHVHAPRTIDGDPLRSGVGRVGCRSTVAAEFAASVPET